MSSKPTTQQVTFAKIYSETGNAIEAYKLAYPDSASKAKYINSTAYRKLDNPKIKALIENIQQGLRAQYIMLAPDALNNLVDLANNAESEKVKLEANKEILYGAGLKPPEQISLKAVGIFGSASPEEIRDLIRAQLEQSDIPSEDKILKKEEVAA